jgi:hypothetical protein
LLDALELVRWLDWRLCSGYGGGSSLSCVSGCQWVSVGVSGCQWVSVGVYPQNGAPFSRRGIFLC